MHCSPLWLMFLPLVTSRTDQLTTLAIHLVPCNPSVGCSPPDIVRLHDKTSLATIEMVRCRFSTQGGSSPGSRFGDFSQATMPIRCPPTTLSNRRDPASVVGPNTTYITTHNPYIIPTAPYLLNLLRRHRIQDLDMDLPT